ncbi:MAG: hypothetical protein RLZZ179_2283 [Verrucomicrobiota bacterium]
MKAGGWGLKQMAQPAIAPPASRLQTNKIRPADGCALLAKHQMILKQERPLNLYKSHEVLRQEPQHPIRRTNQKNLAVKN